MERFCCPEGRRGYRALAMGIAQFNGSPCKGRQMASTVDQFRAYSDAPSGRAI